MEVTSVEQLVEKLKKGKYKSSNDIVEKSQGHMLFILVVIWANFFTVVTSVSDDDDIVAGPQKMSLKCPVR